jgi:hypothetical protein
MFIKTAKEFDRLFKGTDTCSYCGKLLIVPPVIKLDSHTYHLDSARQLAYAILFELAGKPDLAKLDAIQ